VTAYQNIRKQNTLSKFNVTCVPQSVGQKRNKTLKDLQVNTLLQGNYYKD